LSWRRVGLLVLALAGGCYDDHGRFDDAGAAPEEDAGGAPEDAGVLSDGAAEDAGVLPDGAVPPAPCTTVCEPPRLLARVSLDLAGSLRPAVLDAVVHRDDLVVSLLAGDLSGGGDPTPEFSLARISRRTGEVNLEAIDYPTSTESIGAAALASRGETLTLIMVFAARPFPYLETLVRVVTWEGAGPTPEAFQRALTDFPLDRCRGCFRRGASVAIGETSGLVVLADEGVLHVGRVDLVEDTLSRETIEVPSVVPNTALDARADRSGIGVLAVGGVREVPAASASPALAMIATESTLEPAISVPGATDDAAPHPWLHDGTLELVRFVRDEGFSRGRLRRYRIEGSGLTEVGAIETAGDLPPLAVASTPSALVWVESSLASIGEADLRVLASPPRTCERVSPESSIHLPTPLATGFDPRVMTATEADGRTYVALLEQAPGALDTADLVVFDLGACRDTTP